MPLTTGACTDGKVAPIIGPPPISSVGTGCRPPQNASRSSTEVPSGTSTLAGSRTPNPDTVTTRLISGSPRRMALLTARAVAALCTTAPTSAVRLSAGVSRPVTANSKCWADPMGKRVGTVTTRILLSACAALRMAFTALGLLASMAMMMCSTASA